MKYLPQSGVFSLHCGLSGDKPRHSKPIHVRKKLNTISLFSGGGGLDLGFAAAGYRVCCSVDKDPFSCKTLELNSGRKPYFSQSAVITGDIAGVEGKALLKAGKLKASEVDIVIGGPPCQAFSIFGRRGGLKDPRGNLVWEFVRIIKELSPTAFVFENVAGLRTIDNGRLYQDILDALSLDGEYAVSDHNYELADFGIPQFRNRILFIGHKNGRRIPPMSPTHGPGDLFQRLPYVTSETALYDMPEPGPESGLPNHIGRDHSEGIIDRYRSLKFGERDSRTRINKLHPKRPSFTIVVGSDAGGGKGHVHPFSPREVTPRESARLQTFPDWWQFSGTGRHVIRQVGNAVPPLFGALLGDHIRQHIFGARTRTSYETFLDILELDFLKVSSYD